MPALLFFDGVEARSENLCVLVSFNGTHVSVWIIIKANTHIR